MNQEFRRHALTFIFYFGFVALIHLYKSFISLGTESFIPWFFDLTKLFGGGAIGYLLIFTDRILYAYLLHPHQQLSQQVQYLVKQKKFKDVLATINNRKAEQTKLTFRSFLFIVAWVPLSLFALTSTGSLYAGSLVMGLGLHLLYDLWRDQKFNPQILNQKLFWQIKRQVSLKEQQLFLYTFTSAFCLLTLFLL